MPSRHSDDFGVHFFTLVPACHQIRERLTLHSSRPPTAAAELKRPIDKAENVLI
jgi:hypothetical protein